MKLLQCNCLLLQLYSATSCYRRYSYSYRMHSLFSSRFTLLSVTVIIAFSLSPVQMHSSREVFVSGIVSSHLGAELIQYGSVRYFLLLLLLVTRQMSKQTDRISHRAHPVFSDLHSHLSRFLLCELVLLNVNKQMVHCTFLMSLRCYLEMD